MKNFFKVKAVKVVGVVGEGFYERFIAFSCGGGLGGVWFEAGVFCLDFLGFRLAWVVLEVAGRV